MRVLELAECKVCLQKFVRNDKKVVFQPGDEVEVVLLRVAKCSHCKEANNRTIGGARKRLR